jgi:predicted nuclease of restriction endonuclease-like RecB superfamily
MLTSDLLRARLRRGAVCPLYVDTAAPEQLDRARTLVELFNAHIDHTRGDLDDALAALVGDGTDYLLHRGLAKLLSDRCTFAVDAPCEPIELRRRVFEQSARHHPVALVAGDRVHAVTRADVLADVARSLSIDPAQAERALYADLERAHVLRAIDAIDASSLLQRYNVALAQAVLLRASSLTVTIAPGDPARYRQLFRYIKFYRLMHAVRGQPLCAIEPLWRAARGVPAGAAAVQ